MMNPPAPPPTPACSATRVDLLDKRIALHWNEPPHPEGLYPARVTRYHKRCRVVNLAYDDGDEESLLHLDDVAWQVLPDDRFASCAVCTQSIDTAVAITSLNSDDLYIVCCSCSAAFHARCMPSYASLTACESFLEWTKWICVSCMFSRVDNPTDDATSTAELELAADDRILPVLEVCNNAIVVKSPTRAFIIDALQYVPNAAVDRSGCLTSPLDSWRALQALRLMGKYGVSPQPLRVSAALLLSSALHQDENTQRILNSISGDEVPSGEEVFQRERRLPRRVKPPATDRFSTHMAGLATETCMTRSSGLPVVPRMRAPKRKQPNVQTVVVEAEGEEVHVAPVLRFRGTHPAKVNSRAMNENLSAKVGTKRQPDSPGRIKDESVAKRSRNSREVFSYESTFQMPRPKCLNPRRPLLPPLPTGTSSAKRRAICALCGIPGSRPECEGQLLGPFRTSKLSGAKSFHAHRNCLTWSPEVFEGERENDLCGVEDAFLRARRARCVLCGNYGASLSCMHKTTACCRAMHFRCALLSGAVLVAFASSFQTLCPLHINGYVVAGDAPPRPENLHVQTPLRLNFFEDCRTCSQCSEDVFNAASGLILECSTCLRLTHSKCVRPALMPDGLFGVEAGRGNFKCPDCLECVICSGPVPAPCVFTKEVLRCVECRYVSVHKTCRDLTGKRASEVFRCELCRSCRHCAKHMVPLEEWNEELKACRSCVDLYREGKRCPSCDLVYRDDDSDMIQCDTCSLWVHLEGCCGLTSEEIAGLAKADLPYQCPACSAPPPPKPKPKRKRPVRRNGGAPACKRIAVEICNPSENDDCSSGSDDTCVDDTRVETLDPIAGYDFSVGKGCGASVPFLSTRTEDRTGFGRDISFGIDLCLYCGSGGDVRDFRFCFDCGEAFHRFCLLDQLPRVDDGIGKEAVSLSVRRRLCSGGIGGDKLDWRCPRCALCTQCGYGTNVDGNELDMYCCRICNSSVHIECLFDVSKTRLDTQSHTLICHNCQTCEVCGGEASIGGDPHIIAYKLCCSVCAAKADGTQIDEWPTSSSQGSPEPLPTCCVVDAGYGETRQCVDRQSNAQDVHMDVKRRIPLQGPACAMSQARVGDGLLRAESPTSSTEKSSANIILDGYQGGPDPVARVISPTAGGATVAERGENSSVAMTDSDSAHGDSEIPLPKDEVHMRLRDRVGKAGSAGIWSFPVPDERVCELCQQGETERCGRLLPLPSDCMNVWWIHALCALWSEGIRRHVVENTLTSRFRSTCFLLASRRGISSEMKKTFCKECHQVGATVRCSSDMCNARYHYSCALNAGCTMLATTSSEKGKSSASVSVSDIVDLQMICPVHAGSGSERSTVADDASTASITLSEDRKLNIDCPIRFAQLRTKSRRGIVTERHRLRVGGLSVVNPGCLIPTSALFVQNGALIPYRFRAVRRYWSLKELGKRSSYWLEVEGSARAGPVFVIRVEDDPEMIIRSPSAEAAWSKVGNALMLARQCKSKWGGEGRNLPLHTIIYSTGLEMFGLSGNSSSVGMVESLPHAFLFQGRYSFRHGTPPSSRELPFGMPKLTQDGPENLSGSARTEGYVPKRHRRFHGASETSRIPKYRNLMSGEWYQLHVAMGVGDSLNGDQVQAEFDQRFSAIANSHVGVTRTTSRPVQTQAQTVATRFHGRPPLNEDAGIRPRHGTYTALPIAMQHRVMQSAWKRRTVVLRSRIEGWGVFATEDIRANEMIVEYSGELIRPALSDKREALYDSRGIGCYMFEVVPGVIVDATARGNRARYINHSCDPNCFSRTVCVENGRKVIVIFSKRYIHRGEELCYDYQFPLDDEDRVVCECGSDKCKGYMT